MKKTIAAALAVAVLLLTAACSKNTGSVKLADEADSLAYIIGMNVGMNLQRMDSSIRVDAVCEGIRDYLGGNARFTVEEARTYYLRHITYERPERIRAYEEQFLEDIRQSNRSYARTKSGLTYTVEAVGDETFTPANARDTVLLRPRRYGARRARRPAERVAGERAADRQGRQDGGVGTCRERLRRGGR